MAAETPLLAAVVARLANPDIHLAAYGSVTFPLIGILQAPILTLLSLSTAMSKDMDSFLKGRKLMLILGGGLTVLYMIIAYSPIYYVVVEKLIGAPPEIIEPARLGMFVGLPWVFAVAYRRFHQGVMIRLDHSRTVTIGTLIRFMADAIVIILALWIGTIPGTVVATIMMVCGVVTEAIYVGIRVRPVLRHELKQVPSLQDKILLRDMVAFFIPLGLTPLLNQLIRPIGSAALSRMPDPLLTLAIWPVIAGVSFLIVTPGAAFNEVVIALLDRPGARRSLQYFMGILMAVQFILMLIFSLTPLSYYFFWKVSGLPTDLARLASQAFVFLIPSSLISPLNSWFSGLLLHNRQSRVITEGMVLYLSTYVLVLWAGGLVGQVIGIFIVISASMLASIAQTAWLGIRSQPALRALNEESHRFS